MQDTTKELDNDDAVDNAEAPEDLDPVETVVMAKTDFTDNVGDVSVEINVEELVAKVESEHDDDAARKKEIRRKLEDVAENQSFEDTYAVEFDKKK